MDKVIADHIDFESKDDVDGVLTTLTEDVVHDLIGMPWGVQHGLEGARRNYEFFFPNMRVTDIREVARLYGEDHVVFDCEVDAILNGTVVQRPEPEGRSTFRVLHVFEFRDGKISRKDSYWKIVD
jgi:ketosteroid isomerase-like protein